MTQNTHPSFLRNLSQLVNDQFTSLLSQYATDFIFCTIIHK